MKCTPLAEIGRATQLDTTGSDVYRDHSKWKEIVLRHDERAHRATVISASSLVGGQKVVVERKQGIFRRSSKTPLTKVGSKEAWEGGMT